MQVTITIDLSRSHVAGSAIAERYELARILDALAQDRYADAEDQRQLTTRNIEDGRGDIVGRFEVTP
ncbi:MAG: hypothetical protein ABWY78_06450 [Microvirga sp.]